MSDRIHGLDLARFFAFVGMVIVNFKIVMLAKLNSSQLIHLLDGKAAATFVILAGIGASLASRNMKITTLLKRALFLFILGLINTLIFEADILHYYGVYLAIGPLFLSKSNKVILSAAVTSILLFLCFLLLFNYELSWNWETLEYSDFWTPMGFLRNLFFNGFHPTIPWIAFLLFGVWIGRQNIARQQFQKKNALYRKPCCSDNRV